MSFEKVNQWRKMISFMLNLKCLWAGQPTLMHLYLTLSLKLNFRLFESADIKLLGKKNKTDIYQCNRLLCNLEESSVYLSFLLPFFFFFPKIAFIFPTNHWLLHLTRSKWLFSIWGLIYEFPVALPTCESLQKFSSALVLSTFRGNESYTIADNSYLHNIWNTLYFKEGQSRWQRVLCK